MKHVLLLLISSISPIALASPITTEALNGRWSTTCYKAGDKYAKSEKSFKGNKLFALDKHFSDSECKNQINQDLTGSGMTLSVSIGDELSNGVYSLYIENSDQGLKIKLNSNGTLQFTTFFEPNEFGEIYTKLN